jgi:hypothetical protein
VAGPASTNEASALASNARADTKVTATFFSLTMSTLGHEIGVQKRVAKSGSGARIAVKPGATQQLQH